MLKVNTSLTTLKCSPKKSTSLKKTQNFLAEYPYILFLQSLPLSSKDVMKFKIQLKEISNLAFFSIKNTLLHQTLKSESNIFNTLGKTLNLAPLKDLKGYNTFIGGKDLSNLCQIYHKLQGNSKSEKSDFLILGAKVDNSLYGPEEMSEFISKFPNPSNTSKKSASFDSKVIYAQMVMTLESAYRIDFFHALPEALNKKK